MFLENASGTEVVFWLCAVAGTLFFVLRVLLIVVGGFGLDVGHSVGGDVPHDIGGAHDMSVASHSPGQVDSHGTDVAFKMLSLNSISGFVMMFGWIGLSCYKQYSLSMPVSFLLAMLAGLFMMFVTAYLFKIAHKLTSEGAVFKVEQLLGKTAEVYHRIPGDGKGKIQIAVEGIMREVDAVAEDKQPLDSFTKVTVTAVVNPQTVYVKKINS